MSIDSDTILGFSAAVLGRSFDDPKPTPEFHKEMWDYCCSDHSRVAICAPRGHAKSTAVTFVYVLAMVLFRVNDYVMIVSDTESQAKEFLHNINQELKDNEDLREIFGVERFIRDNETDIIVQFRDGTQFRIIAKGSEQKLRGMLWRHKRPNLIVCDDLENDEIVMNEDRREKFRKWFFNALIPTLADKGKIRIVGTILHLDSLLERLLNDDTWLSKRYRAHNEDFSEILWPEKFTAEDLKKIRRSFVNQGMPDGYSQEYLNYPIDTDTAFFRAEDMLEADEDLLRLHGEHYIGVDLAISEKDRSAFTAMIVAKRIHDGRVIVVDVNKGRWDSKDIIDNLFALAQRYDPALVIMESEKVEKSLGPFIQEEMIRRGVFFNIERQTPTADKWQRARPIQAMMRAGQVYFRKDTEWYPDLENELLKFPKYTYQDQVDALSWIGVVLNKITEGMTEEEEAEEEYLEELEESVDIYEMINPITGY